jgi:hypothetical protein
MKSQLSISSSLIIRKVLSKKSQNPDSFRCDQGFIIQDHDHQSTDKNVRTGHPSKNAHDKSLS